MLESSFDKDINLRPKASLFYDIIRDELKTLRHGDARGLNDTWIQRRRSEVSFTRLISEEDLKRLSVSSRRLEIPAEIVRLMSDEE